MSDDEYDPRPLLLELGRAHFDAHLTVAEALAREARAVAERRYPAGADATPAHHVIAEVQLLERLLPRSRIAREHGDPLAPLGRDLWAAIGAVHAAIAALHKAA